MVMIDRNNFSLKVGFFLSASSLSIFWIGLAFQFVIGTAIWSAELNRMECNLSDMVSFVHNSWFFDLLCAILFFKVNWPNFLHFDGDRVWSTLDDLLFDSRKKLGVLISPHIIKH